MAGLIGEGQAVAYAVLAQYYDELMVEVDYREWFEQLLRLCAQHHRPLLPGDHILDLACGTGVMTLQMAKAGYRVTGVDLSAEMLAVADQRLRSTGQTARLVAADMRDFRLDENFSCVFCLCDSLNYLTDQGELTLAFAQVEAMLEVGGLFVFDVNTEYKLREIYGDATYAERRDSFSYIWENAYDPKQRMCQMDLAFYIKDADGRFSEYTETHWETAFAHEEIAASLNQVGLDILGAYGDDFHGAPTSTTQRVTYVTQKSNTQG